MLQNPRKTLIYATTMNNKQSLMHVVWNFGSDSNLKTILQDEKKLTGRPYRDNDNVKNAIVRVS